MWKLWRIYCGSRPRARCGTRARIVKTYTRATARTGAGVTERGAASYRSPAHAPGLPRRTEAPPLARRRAQSLQEPRPRPRGTVTAHAPSARERPPQRPTDAHSRVGAASAAHPAYEGAPDHARAELRADVCIRGVE